MTQQNEKADFSCVTAVVCGGARNRMKSDQSCGPLVCSHDHHHHQVPFFFVRDEFKLDDARLKAACLRQASNDTDEDWVRGILECVPSLSPRSIHTRELHGTVNGSR